MEGTEPTPADGSSPAASSSAAPRPVTKLFLGGLSWETTEEKLREHFVKFGEVTEVIVMRERGSNRPRGFGFITFKDEAAAQAATAEQHTIDSRTIDAKPSVPQGEGQRPRSKKIFVGGLAPDTTEEQFKEYFSQYGTILEAQIMQDHSSGRSRGFGFVTFEDEGAVEKVFSAGAMHEVNGKKVEVKNATPKGSGPQGAYGGSQGFAQPRGYYGRGDYGDHMQAQAGYGYGMHGGFNMASTGYAGYVVPYGYMSYGAGAYGMYPGYQYQSYPNSQGHYGGNYSNYGGPSRRQQSAPRPQQQQQRPQQPQ